MPTQITITVIDSNKAKSEYHIKIISPNLKLKFWEIPADSTLISTMQGHYYLYFIDLSKKSPPIPTLPSISILAWYTSTQALPENNLDEIRKNFTYTLSSTKWNWQEPESIYPILCSDLIQQLETKFTQQENQLTQLKQQIQSFPLQVQLEIINETVNLMESTIEPEIYRARCKDILNSHPITKKQKKNCYKKILEIAISASVITAATAAGLVLGLLLGAKISGPLCIYFAILGAIMGAVAGIYFVNRPSFSKYLDKFSLFSSPLERTIESLASEDYLKNR